MEAGFLSVDSPHLVQALAQVDHDFFHLPDYLRLTAQYERGEPLVFLAQEQGCLFLVPLIVRPIDSLPTGVAESLYDATSPYGYASPLVKMQPLSDAFLDRSITSLVTGLKGRNIVSCFCRLHPLLELPLAALEQAGEVTRHGNTVSIDLTQSEEAIIQEFRRDLRKQIRHAEKKGQTAAIDENWEAFDAFVDMYHDNMRRLSAREFYLFPREYFEGLRDKLRGRIHLSIARVHGELAAAGLVTEAGGIVSTYLSATVDRFVPESPLKLLKYIVCRWAKTRGNRILHLGGGVGGKEDSLFYFKAGFSPRRHLFCTWRLIPHPAAYETLVNDWENRNPGKAPGDFFPAYRNPD